MNTNDQQFMAQKIRTQYMEQSPSALDELRRLDAEAKRPANVFAYLFGSLGAVIMGVGMSLVMTDFGSILGIAEPLVPGILVGILGMAIAIFNYPIYRRILSSRKKKFANKIIALSDEMMKG